MSLERLPVILFITFLVGLVILPILGQGVTGGWTRRRTQQAGLVTAVVVGLWQIISLDGVDGLAICGVGSGQTLYARSYSAVGFWRVRPGMSETDVLSLVGEPLDRHIPENEAAVQAWRWSKPGNYSSYHVRAVVFRDGRVVRKSSECYPD